MDKKEHLICALDTADILRLHQLVEELCYDVGMFKVGLEAYVSLGSTIIDKINTLNGSVFLDLKFYDIPNTVYKTIRNFDSMFEKPYRSIEMLTVHAIDADVIKAAVDASNGIAIIGVTLLTSNSSENALDIVKERTELALTFGAAGIVCSPREVKEIRQEFGNDFKIITPGIRPSWYNNKDDQNRVGTPKQVIDDGATYMVVGRPITNSDNPREAALRILDEL